MKQLLGRYTFEVPIRERQKTEDGHGHKWVTLGHQRMTVDVEIDMSKVAGLAQRAAYNSSLRSVVGPIVAKARKV